MKRRVVSFDFFELFDFVFIDVFGKTKTPSHSLSNEYEEDSIIIR